MNEIGHDKSSVAISGVVGRRFQTKSHENVIFYPLFQQILIRNPNCRRRDATTGSNFLRIFSASNHERFSAAEKKTPRFIMAEFENENINGRKEQKTENSYRGIQAFRDQDSV